MSVNSRSLQQTKARWSPTRSPASGYMLTRWLSWLAQKEVDHIEGPEIKNIFITHTTPRVTQQASSCLTSQQPWKGHVYITQNTCFRNTGTPGGFCPSTSTQSTHQPNRQQLRRVHGVRTSILTQHSYILKVTQLQILFQFPARSNLNYLGKQWFDSKYPPPTHSIAIINQEMILLNLTNKADWVPASESSKKK